ncbi:MAG TPA: helix-turn-helix domain-containing protein [Candidatus Pacearchaeota archaeon]|nr:helix-turn-helix domain-containing protein [Candidatus Pacearchaeota archaeon]
MAEEIQKCGIIPLKLLNSKEISLKAKGIFAYIQSKPKDWQFSVDRISSQMKEGQEAIRSALKELEEAGYLKRVPKRNEKNWFSGYDYILVYKK